MTKPMTEEKAKARELRRDGWSYGEIAKELAVSKSSVKNWCHDIELSVEQEAAINHRKQQWGDKNKGAITNKLKAQQQRLLFQELGRQKRDWVVNSMQLAVCFIGLREQNQEKTLLFLRIATPK